MLNLHPNVTGFEPLCEHPAMSSQIYCGKKLLSYVQTLNQSNLDWFRRKDAVMSLHQIRSSPEQKATSQPGVFLTVTQCFSVRSRLFPSFHHSFFPIQALLALQSEHHWVYGFILMRRPKCTKLQRSDITFLFNFTSLFFSWKCCYLVIVFIFVDLLCRIYLPWVWCGGNLIFLWLTVLSVGLDRYLRCFHSVLLHTSVHEEVFSLLLCSLLSGYINSGFMCSHSQTKSIILQQTAILSLIVRMKDTKQFTAVILTCILKMLISFHLNEFIFFN